MSAMGTRTSQYSGSYVCIKGLDRGSQGVLVKV